MLMIPEVNSVSSVSTSPTNRDAIVPASILLNVSADRCDSFSHI